MTSRHRITCIAVSAAVALKLFAGTADARVSNSRDRRAQGPRAAHRPARRERAARRSHVLRRPLHLQQLGDLVTASCGGRRPGPRKSSGARRRAAPDPSARAAGASRLRSPSRRDRRTSGPARCRARSSRRPSRGRRVRARGRRPASGRARARRRPPTDASISGLRPRSCSTKSSSAPWIRGVVSSEVVNSDSRSKSRKPPDEDPALLVLVPVVVGRAGRSAASETAAPATARSRSSDRASG